MGIWPSSLAPALGPSACKASGGGGFPPEPGPSHKAESVRWEGRRSCPFGQVAPTWEGCPLAHPMAWFKEGGQDIEKLAGTPPPQLKQVCVWG